MSYLPRESYIVGRKGENLAAEYIKERGFFISARNYKSAHGEIDIIAENRKFVVFVEVKLRRENAGYFPREAITKDKKQRLIFTARNYIFRSHSALIPRFDIIEITLPEDGDFSGATLNHIENAFEVSSDDFY